MKGGIVSYKGKLIEDMTREELISALKCIGNLYTKKLEDNISNKRTNLWQI